MMDFSVMIRQNIENVLIAWSISLKELFMTNSVSLVIGIFVISTGNVIVKRAGL